MRKYLRYFQKVDSLSLCTGVLIGLMLLSVFNESSMDVNATESNELHLTEDTEIVNLDDLVLPQPIEEVAPIEVGTDLVSEEILTKSSVTQSKSVGIDLVEKNVKNEIKIAESDVNVPNELAGCRSWNITYMAYTAVTDVGSKQYALLNSDKAYTDPDTGIRMVDGRYCIALGSYYTHNVGQYVDLVFADGTIVPCILGDCKADIHTDPTNRFHSVDGSVAEFIVDMEYFNSTAQWKSLCSGTIDKVVVL